MSERTVDVVVIGCGPAGLAAAEVVAQSGATCVAIDRMGPGGQVMNLGAVTGVPDLEAGAMGPDVVATLTDKAMTAGCDLAIDDVQRVTLSDGAWLIEALEGRFRAKAVVIATGLTPGTTGLGNEASYEGRGLSHCAHCDAPLYEGKPVAVAGSDGWTVEEAIELAGHASRVTLVIDGPLTASPDTMARLTALPNVATVEGRIAALDGPDGLEHVEVVAGGPPARIEAKGLFLYTSRTPARAFLDPDLDEADGLYWAGDVRQGATPAITEAIADGQRAGHNAVLWARARPTA